MSNLSFTDRLKLERLLGMSSGYVLDFSNRTFQEFVNEAVHLDILAEQFNQGSGSKANRLRALLERQPDQVVGKLILALFRYQKEFCSESMDADLWASCIGIGNRLCGIQGSKSAQTSRAEQSLSTQTNHTQIIRGDEAKERELSALLQKFEEMAISRDPHRRGYLLQDILNRAFVANGIPTVKSFTRNNGGEQIDGAFRFDGWHYIAECRWREQLADIRQLDGLKGQVDRSGKQTMGVFISINGWSVNVPPLLKQNREKCIFLMDGYDLRCVLNQEIELSELLIRKLTHLNIEAEPYLSAASISRKS